MRGKPLVFAVLAFFLAVSMVSSIHAADYPSDAPQSQFTVTSGRITVPFYFVETYRGYDIYNCPESMYKYISVQQGVDFATANPSDYHFHSDTLEETRTRIDSLLGTPEPQNIVVPSLPFQLDSQTIIIGVVVAVAVFVFVMDRRKMKK